VHDRPKVGVVRNFHACFAHIFIFTLVPPSFLINLVTNSVACAVQNRTSPAFEDPTDDGLAKMCNTAWVTDILAKVDSPQTDDENLDG
jgi:hypothetical protein